MKKIITIDGIEYIPKNKKAQKRDGLRYVIVRTFSAGVFAGYLEKKVNQNVILKNARRLWYWDGSASLSELAVRGVSKPGNCKFPCEVEKIELDQVIEVIDCTEEARKSIANVKEWTVH